jgi:hypothetical protein
MLSRVQGAILLVVSSAQQLPVSTAVSGKGGFRGSALHHSFLGFERRFGPAAAHATIVKLPPVSRVLVKPNTPAFGVLAARIYPYSFVGDMIRSMRDVVRAKDEDVFVRELVVLGLDVLMGTVHRVLVRWLLSPNMFLSKRQEIWELYHDHGKLNVVSQTETSYVIEDAEWSNTDALVCKVNFEARKRFLEMMGLRRVEGRREKCRAWGHASCVTRFWWEG